MSRWQKGFFAVGLAASVSVLPASASHVPQDSSNDFDNARWNTTTSQTQDPSAPTAVNPTSSLPDGPRADLPPPLRASENDFDSGTWDEAGLEDDVDESAETSAELPPPPTMTQTPEGSERYEADRLDEREHFDEQTEEVAGSVGDVDDMLRRRDENAELGTNDNLPPVPALVPPDESGPEASNPDTVDAPPALNEQMDDPRAEGEQKNGGDAGTADTAEATEATEAPSAEESVSSRGADTDASEPDDGQLQETATESVGNGPATGEDTKPASAEGPAGVGEAVEPETPTADAPVAQSPSEASPSGGPGTASEEVTAPAADADVTGDQTSEPIPEPAPQPAPASTPEPAPEPVSEETTEPAQELPAESTPSIDEEPAQEPAPAPAAEPSAETTAEPAAEQAAEHAAEPTPEPAAASKPAPAPDTSAPDVSDPEPDW